MEYTFFYKGLSERALLIQDEEAQGHVLLHDNLDPLWQPGLEPWGELIFTDPIPPPLLTPLQEVLGKFTEDCNAAHMTVFQAIKNWDQLTLAQKDQLLRFLAKFYIVVGARLGIF